MFVPKREEGSNKWQFRDIEEMGQYANSSPVLIDADASEMVILCDIPYMVCLYF